MLVVFGGNDDQVEVGVGQRGPAGKGADQHDPAYVGIRSELGDDLVEDGGQSDPRTLHCGPWRTAALRRRSRASQAATGDEGLPDAERLAAHARANGVDVRLEIYPVAAQSFQLYWAVLSEAADALDQMAKFIGSAR